jgi:hypothetical protein
LLSITALLMSITYALARLLLMSSVLMINNAPQLYPVAVVTASSSGTCTAAQPLQLQLAAQCLQQDGQEQKGDPASTR